MVPIGSIPSVYFPELMEIGQHIPPPNPSHASSVTTSEAPQPRVNVVGSEF